MAVPSDEQDAVRDNPERQRFEMPLLDELPPGVQAIAFIDYRDRPAISSAAAGTAASERGVRVRILTHAEVPAELRGARIGARLARGTLDLIRARGERIVPRCPFVVDFLRRHPEYVDLVAD
jgi:hypothetical protein